MDTNVSALKLVFVSNVDCYNEEKIYESAIEIYYRADFSWAIQEE